MAPITRWIPAIHDTILIAHHARGRTDTDISDLMLNNGYAVSRDDVKAARRRLKLEANRPTPYLVKQGPPIPTERPNPIAVAETWLGKRLKKTPACWLLDDIPTKFDKVMQEVNRLLKASGAEQLQGSDSWKV